MMLRLVTAFNYNESGAPRTVRNGTTTRRIRRPSTERVGRSDGQHCRRDSRRGGSAAPHTTGSQSSLLVPLNLYLKSPVANTPRTVPAAPLTAKILTLHISIKFINQTTSHPYRPLRLRIYVTRKNEVVMRLQSVFVARHNSPTLSTEVTSIHT